MQSTFEKILKDGERKGYFRLHNDGAKIEYLPSGHKENLNDPEEKVRAEYYFDLIEKYGYPATRIGLEVEMPDRTPERYADIVIYENDAHILEFRPLFRFKFAEIVLAKRVFYRTYADAYP